MLTSTPDQTLCTKLLCRLYSNVSPQSKRNFMTFTWRRCSARMKVVKDLRIGSAFILHTRPVSGPE
jgi:hypothetical protein